VLELQDGSRDRSAGGVRSGFRRHRLDRVEAVCRQFGLARVGSPVHCIILRLRSLNHGDLGSEEKRGSALMESGDHLADKADVFVKFGRLILSHFVD